MKKRILIYEDNRDLCEALAQLINMSDKYTCSGAFNNCRGVLNDLKTLEPQVILMDIDMPGRNGIEAVTLIRQVDKEVKIIMLTVFDDNQNVMAAISAGASGYLLKKYCFEKLVGAIDEALNGGAPLTGTIARMVMDQLVNQSSTGASENFDLTKREKEILNGLVKGLSYKMIAGSLNISFETVKSHIRNIYEKLQVHNQSEAVAKSIKNRIV
jgi:DNA-binding NarL/FixJ family response regulator